MPQKSSVIIIICLLANLIVEATYFTCFFFKNLESVSYFENTRYIFWVFIINEGQDETIDEWINKCESHLGEQDQPVQVFL